MSTTARLKLTMKGPRSSVRLAANMALYSPALAMLLLDVVVKCTASPLTDTASSSTARAAIVSMEECFICSMGHMQP